MKQAIVLCSGGIDSVTTAYYVKKKLNYEKMTFLFFNYNQHSLHLERKYSKSCARKLKADFLEISLPELAKLSTSLINMPGKVNSLKREELKDSKKESDKFYVPFRNTLFLSYALALADSLYISKKTLSDIFVGFKCEGKESYPDVTRAYLRDINQLAQTASEGNFRIFAPLIKKDKEDIILLGKKLSVDFTKTVSCYNARKNACGTCLACMLRKEGFYWAGLKDETEYINPRFNYLNKNNLLRFN